MARRLRKRTKIETSQCDGDSYECDICKKTFSREDTWIEHIDSVHWEEAKCDICSKVLSSRQALQRHQRTHSDERQYLCTQCPKKFKRLDTLRDHQRCVHREQHEAPEEGKKVFIPRQCRWCLDKKFAHHQMIWCMRFGQPRSEHQCLICLKTTRFCFTLTEHHDEEHNLDEIPMSNVFQCEKCYRLFVSSKSLKQHSCELIPKELEYQVYTGLGKHSYPTVSYV